MSAGTIYARAKAELERRGWHQGAYAADQAALDDCAVCLIGALHVACHGHPYSVGIASLTEVPADHHPVCESAGALVKLGKHLAYDPPRWNDNPDRTVAEVYALLDEMDRLEREAVRA